MTNRIALFAASLAAALSLAVGLAVAGFAPRTEPATAIVADPAAAATTAAPTIQVDTVYVAPAPTPQDVTVTQVAPGGQGGDDGPGEVD